MMSAVAAERLPERDIVRPLDAFGIPALAGVLSHALGDEGHFRYMIPDVRERREILFWFFNSVAIPISLRCGEVYTTRSVDAAVLWIRPEWRVTFKRMLRTAMREMPLNVDTATFRRCLNVGWQIEKVVSQLAGEPHWYLVSLGIGHSREGAETGRALLEPVLSHADREQVPCYAESFDETTLCFYQRLGFRIEGAGEISKDGPSFWALIRPPRLARRPDDRIADCSLS
jgi:hypothetical protein